MSHTERKGRVQCAPSPRAGVSLAIGMLALALAGCGDGGGAGGAGAGRRKEVPPVSVVIAPATASDLTYVIEGTGSLEAYQMVTVAARVDGVVESVTFEEGDAVDPTKTLAVIDGKRRALERDESAAAVEQARAAGPSAAAVVLQNAASVERAKAQEAAARGDAAEAEAMLRRRSAANEATPGAVSPEEIERARAEAARKRDAVLAAASVVREAEATQRGAEARKGETEAGLRLAEARLATAEKTLADTVVKAPIPGVARRRFVTLGQYVRAGDPLVELVDRGRLRVRFRVSEAESVNLATGMEMRFLVPSLSPERHVATLVHVDETASPVTRMVECLGEAKDPAPSLKPGFFVQALVETQRARAIAVPESAVFPGENGWIVYVVEEGVARRRAVLLGLRTRGRLVEVREGLREGEKVVVEGGHILSDRMKVKPAEKAAGQPDAPPVGPARTGT